MTNERRINHQNVSQQRRFMSSDAKREKMCSAAQQRSLQMSNVGEELQEKQRHSTMQQKRHLTEEHKQPCSAQQKGQRTKGQSRPLNEHSELNNVAIRDESNADGETDRLLILAQLAELLMESENNFSSDGNRQHHEETGKLYHSQILNEMRGDQVHDKMDQTSDTAETALAEARAGKRISTEAPAEGGSNTIPAQRPTCPELWKPTFLLEPGRPMTVEDQILERADPLVLGALARACALPKDMAQLEGYDDTELILSSLQSTFAVVQMCMVALERLHNNGLAIPKLEAENKTLQIKLSESTQVAKKMEEMKDGFKIKLERVKEEKRQLEQEAEAERKRGAELEAFVEKQKNIFEARLQAQDERIAELERLKEEAEARIESKSEAAFDEGFEHAAKVYKVQVFKVRDKSWALGWRTALKEVGIPKDHPAYQNPPKFPSPKQGSSSGPSASKAPLEAAAPEPPPTQTEAPQAEAATVDNPATAP